MPVTVRNYILPIRFTYRGWEVALYDAPSFFQFSDVRVEVNISIDRMPYYSILQKIIQQKQQQCQQDVVCMINRKYGKAKSTAIQKQYEQVFKAINDFFDAKKTIKYIEKANGGMLDRFLGQNLSGVEKVEQNVKSYIDLNLGTADVRDELVSFLKQRGL